MWLDTSGLYKALPAFFSGAYNYFLEYMNVGAYVNDCGNEFTFVLEIHFRLGNGSIKLFEVCKSAFVF